MIINLKFSIMMKIQKNQLRMKIPKKMKITTMKIILIIKMTIPTIIITLTMIIIPIIIISPIMITMNPKSMNQIDQV